MDPSKTQKSTQKKRRKYDETFKAEVLAMVASGQQASEVARRLGIGESIIYKWKKRANHSINDANQIAPTTEAAQENIALRKELQRTIMERDILKKALNIAAGARSAGRANNHLSDDTNISIRFSGTNPLRSTRGQ